MAERSETAFIAENADDLNAFWNRIKDHLLDWRLHYQWPPGADPVRSLDTRTQLEQRIRTELDKQNHLSKATFDAVIRWGFGSDSECSDQEVREATRLAFGHLNANRVASAAMELVKLPRVGISRASRTKDFCRAFEEYTWTLRYLRNLGRRCPSLGLAVSRVADLEMALFVRSRSGQIALVDRSPAVPKHLQQIAGHDEENAFWTLGPGGKSKQFWAICDSSTATIWTGKKKTPKTLTAEDIGACLAHFGYGAFPLSNSKTSKDRDPRGLGTYFAQNFGSSVFASHFAALWVHQGLLKPSLRQGAW